MGLYILICIFAIALLVIIIVEAYNHVHKVDKMSEATYIETIAELDAAMQRLDEVTKQANIELNKLIKMQKYYDEFEDE